MGISLVGLIVIAVAALVLLYVGAKGLLVVLGLFKSMQSGQVTLACPHCGQQTSPGHGRCDVCGREL